MNEVGASPFSPWLQFVTPESGEGARGNQLIELFIVGAVTMFHVLRGSVLVRLGLLNVSKI